MGKVLSIALLMSLLGTLSLTTGTSRVFNQSVWNGTSSNGTNSNGTSSNGTGVNNTKSNNSTTGPQSQPLNAFGYFQIFFCVVIMVTGFVGNLMVILIFTRRWKVLKTCEVFMISLAVADIIGTFTIPLERLRDLLQLHDTGNGDFIGCQISTWLASTCISVSSLTLVAIAIDRFVIVFWPFKLRHGPNPVIYISIWLTWLIGGIYAAPHFKYLKQMYQDNAGYHCRSMMQPEEHHKYVVAIFVLQLAIPLCAMTFLYAFIVFKLRSGSVSARRLSETDNVVRIRTLRQRKATKLFIVVVVVFTVLVLPINIFMLLASSHKIPHTKETRAIYNFLVLMLASNSCVNPMIYSRLHKSFRRSTLSLIFGCCIPKYYRFEWDSKFVSRSSVRRRWRDQSNTRNTVASFRKSASPIPEDLVANGASTPKRTLSAVSSRSSRLSSAESDDVFLRKASVKSPVKSEENHKLQKIPEASSSLCVQDSPMPIGGSETPEPKPGKYIQFVNCPTQGDNEADGRAKTVDSSDVQLHCVPEIAAENSSEGSIDEKGDNKVTSNGYTSLNGTPYNDAVNAYFKDTEL